MVAEEELNSSLEYTPTWMVAGVCFVIVLLSLCVERGLHKLEKCLLHEKQDALYEALQKLKEGEGSVVIIGRIASSTHLHLRISSCSRDLLCLNYGSWRGKSNVPVTIHDYVYNGYDFMFYVFTVQYGLPYADTTMEALGGIHPEGWYLWLFVVLFFLLNVDGWNTYFWLAFLPLILLLLVGAKLEHIMEKLGYIIARLIMGLVVQILCSYSTLPLYAIVTQMGTMFKEGMFDQMVQSAIGLWAGDVISRRESSGRSSGGSAHNMINDGSSRTVHVAEKEMVAIDNTTYLLPHHVQPPSSSS